MKANILLKNRFSPCNFRLLFGYAPAAQTDRRYGGPRKWGFTTKCKAPVVVVVEGGMDVPSKRNMCLCPKCVAEMQRVLTGGKLVDVQNVCFKYEHFLSTSLSKRS